MGEMGRAFDGSYAEYAYFLISSFIQLRLILIGLL